MIRSSFLWMGKQIMVFRPTPHDYATILRAPLYSALPMTTRETLLGYCSERIFKRGESLFMQGDLAENLFLVLEGWVKVFRLSPDGSEAVLHIFRAGESFAEPAAFGLGRYPAHAEAAADGRLLVIPAGALMAEVDRTPGLAMKIIGLMSQRLHALIAETERRQFLSTPHRLAAFLADLLATDEQGGATAEAPSATVTLPYDKGLVAARLGMTPESFSRALAKLKGEGITSQGNKIFVADRHKLLALARQEDF